MDICMQELCIYLSNYHTTYKEAEGGVGDTHVGCVSLLPYIQSMAMYVYWWQRQPHMHHRHVVRSYLHIWWKNDGKKAQMLFNFFSHHPLLNNMLKKRKREKSFCFDQFSGQRTFLLCIPLKARKHCDLNDFIFITLHLWRVQLS